MIGIDKHHCANGYY